LVTIYRDHTMKIPAASSRSLLLPLLFPAAVLLTLPTLCAADTGLIVPSYFYPGTGGPGGVGNGWAAMDTAAAQVPLIAVFNPDSGPLPGPADPNYVNALTNLENAGGKVAAYVFTNNGNTPLTSVESQISTYLTQYGHLIEGFYLDGMLLLPSTLSYYQTLDTYIHGLSASDLVIGNPGQPFLNGLLPSDYLSAAGIFNIFEGPNTAPSPGTPGFNAYPYGLNWFQSYPSNRFSNTIFDAPDSSLLPDLDKAVALNAGYVYITNETLPNPYSQLPSYWDQEVSALVAANAVPEPGTLSLLIVGGLIALPLAAAKRRA
jgi:Spherulation-specific family 4